MSKPITGCIVAAPLSAERAKIMIQLLQKGELRRKGFTAEITVRERRPDDTDDMLQSVNGVHRNEIRTAAQAICPECPDTEKADLAIKEAI